MPAASAVRARRLRTWSLLGVVVLIAALVLTSCPDLRDGTPGQLAVAEQETESAARSAALALELWTRDRAYAAWTSVAVSDARDEVVKAYETVAGVTVDNPADLARQDLLNRSMTEIVGLLNAAGATVDQVSHTQSPTDLGHALTTAADALAGGYR